MRLSFILLAAMIGLTDVAIAQVPAAPLAPPRAPAAPAALERERPPTPDEELALAALEGLMAQPAERALPLIRKVLAGQQTTLVKRRALFVLSQIESPEARQILAQTSRSADAALRGEAIRAIGISGDREALDALRQVYASGPEAVKSEVLQAWMIAGHKEAIYQAAANATSETEAGEAIRLLGVMGAADELRKLGDRPKAASGLVDAYAISGDLAGLRKMAESGADRDVRLSAIRRIGTMPGPEASVALRELYARAADAELREAALQGMLIAQDEEGVLALYRAAKTNDEKRKLLRTLSMIDGDAALEAIDAALEGAP